VIEKDIVRMAKQLGPGDRFPNYTVPTTDGRTINIPADLTGEYAVVIFYRGVW
jgi:peroxiredoxin